MASPFSTYSPKQHQLGRKRRLDSIRIALLSSTVGKQVRDYNNYSAGVVPA